MLKELFWRQHYISLIFYYGIFFCIGLVTGDITCSLLIACMINLVWNYHFQYRLIRWLWSRSTLVPPKGYGSWEHVFHGIYLLQQRHRNRRKDLVNLIRRFREGGEALPDAAVVFHKEGHIIWCNRISSRLLSFKWPEDAGQQIGNLIRFPEFHTYLKSQDFKNPLEISPDSQQQTTLEFRIMPYTNDQYLLVVRDVTMLRQLEHMRKQFVANVSHELRTPLTVLKGYLELFNSADSNTIEHVHHVLLEQTNRMDNLVNQLLTLSKIEASPLDSPSSLIDVPQLIRLCVLEAKTISGDKKHQFELAIDDNLHIYGDEHQFRSAISNLIHNAARYTPDAKRIQISWKKQTKGAYFAVLDEGEGIAEKHLAYLTRRFYRVDEARSRATGGAGLGLAIVKHALHRHETTLDIHSQVGIGSRFSFIVPTQFIAPSKQSIQDTPTALDLV